MLDVESQVRRNLVGVTLQLLEVQLASVVEPLPGSLIQDWLDVLDAACFERRGFIEDFLLGRLQHTIEAAKDRKGQDDFAVLRWLVGAA